MSVRSRGITMVLRGLPACGKETLHYWRHEATARSIIACEGVRQGDHGEPLSHIQGDVCIGAPVLVPSSQEHRSLPRCFRCEPSVTVHPGGCAHILTEEARTT